MLGCEDDMFYEGLNASTTLRRVLSQKKNHVHGSVEMRMLMRVG